MDVSIVIVNYNTCALLKNCLNSVYSYTKGVEFEVIVSDNGSSDGSIAMIKTTFPQVILLENNYNYGFGKANNIAQKYAKGKYIFYLNSDTILGNNAVKIFFDYWEKSPESKEIGGLGCLLTKNNYYVHSFAAFPTKKSILTYYFRAVASSSIIGKIYRLLRHNKRFVKNEVKQTNDNLVCRNEYITGADLFLKNNELSRFDENYFMYFEETDLQYNNFYKHNKKLIILYEPKIEHLEGGSDSKKKNVYTFKKKTTMFFWESCILYIRKNIERSSFFIFFLKVLLTIKYICPSNIFFTYKYITRLWKK